MKLDRDFRQVVASFVAEGVRFLVVGGYALAAHGLPRSTGDFDAWVWASPQNAARAVRALEAFGFAGLGLGADDFSREDSVVQLGIHRTGSTSSGRSTASSSKRRGAGAR